MMAMAVARRRNGPNTIGKPVDRWLGAIALRKAKVIWEQ